MSNEEDIFDLIHCDNDGCGLYIHCLLKRNPSITWNYIQEILDERESKLSKEELKDMKIIFEEQKLYYKS